MYCENSAREKRRRSVKSLSEAYVQSLSGDGAKAKKRRKRSAPVAECGPVLEELVADEIGRAHILCAEPGMGKTLLVSRALEARARRGAKTRYEDMCALVHDEVSSRLSELMRWCKKRHEDGSFVALGIDNFPACDEAEAELAVRCFRAMVSLGVSLYIALLPEGETLVEQYGEAACFWSCNMRAARPSDATDALAFDKYARGVPCLADALERVPRTAREHAMSDPGYLQAYADVVSASLRHGVMGEERRIRAALLLLGNGTFEDTEACVGRVEADLWLLLARDAPLFGIDASSGTFFCAGANATDGIIAVYSCLKGVVEDLPDVVAAIVRRLCDRGDFGRAATVSMMCSSEALRCGIAFEWAAEFINVGELGVVTDALECVRNGEVQDIEGLSEADALVSALMRPASDVTSQDSKAGFSTRQAHAAELGAACRAFMATAAWQDDIAHRDDDGPIADALAMHGTAVWLMANGQLEDAYTALIDVPQRLGPTTLSSSLLEMDFVMCSLLMGIAPGRMDLSEIGHAGELYARMGLQGLAGMQGALMPIGVLLGGRKPATASFETQVHRASRMGDTLLQGFYLLVSAVLDIRVGAFVRAHVRLGQAHGQFEAVGATFLTKVAHILDICVRIQLSEHVTHSEISSCRGGGRSLNRVVTILRAAVSTRRSNRPVGSGRWDLKDCPRDVHWILNVMAGDFGALSQKIREVMPRVWRDAVQKGAADVDALLDGDAKSPSVADSPKADATEEQTHDDLPKSRVSIRMLGGFEVYVDKMAIGNGLLERRRARSMLALLAAVPGHVAKRFTIMESVWPEYDYERANRCVYSATTVLRTEMSSILGDEDGPAVVIVSKADRTVALNPAMVTCDVDVFEKRAHMALDNDGDDRLVVGICRELEGLYRGGLCVPPADASGIIAARANELRELYADAMVAGAQAARRIELKTLACRFAKRAHEADDLREDVMQVLLSALCEAGRQVEAEQLYEQFVSHVVDVTRRPPSRGMRKAVGTFALGSAEERRAKRHAARREGARKQAEIIEVKLAQPSEQLSLDLGDEDE